MSAPPVESAPSAGAGSFELTVVVAGTRRPLEAYAVRCHRVEGAGPDERKTRLEGAHPGGVAVVGGVRPGSNLLVVLPEDPAFPPSRVVRFTAPAEGAIAPVRVEVTKGEPLRIRLTRSGGRPVAGSRVELVDPDGWTPFPLDARAGDPRDPGFAPQSGGPMPILLSSATTDEEGNASLFGPPGREGLAIRVAGEAHAAVVHEGIVVLEKAPPLEIVLPAAPAPR